MLLVEGLGRAHVVPPPSFVMRVCPGLRPPLTQNVVSSSHATLERRRKKKKKAKNRSGIIWLEEEKEICF